MNLIKLNEFPSYRVNNIEHVLDGFFKNDWSFKNKKNSINLIFDITQDEKRYVLITEIPGVNKSDLKIEIFEKTFKISGTKKEPDELKNKTLYFNKMSFGDFNQKFNLPDKIDRSKIQASFNNGILKVIIPKEKHVEIKPTLIKIK